jgi:hypothetical protein
MPVVTHTWTRSPECLGKRLIAAAASRLCRDRNTTFEAALAAAAANVAALHAFASGLVIVEWARGTAPTPDQRRAIKRAAVEVLSGKWQRIAVDVRHLVPAGD